MAGFSFVNFPSDQGREKEETHDFSSDKMALYRDVVIKRLNPKRA